MSKDVEKSELLKEIAKYAGEINRHQRSLRSYSARIAQAPISRQFSSHKPYGPPRTRISPSSSKAAKEYLKQDTKLILNDNSTNNNVKKTLLKLSRPAKDKRNKTIDLAKLRERFDKKKNKFQVSRSDCLFYNKTGHCTFKNCRLNHSSDRVSICKGYLNGRCQKESATETIGLLDPTYYRSVPDIYCPRSHYLTAFKVPICLAYLRGKCSLVSIFSEDKLYADSFVNPRNLQDQCPFVHARKEPATEVCKLFSKGYYCPDGPYKCSKKHLIACQNDEESCPGLKECTLIHFKEAAKSAVPSYSDHDVETGQIIPLEWTDSDDNNEDNSIEIN